MALPRKEKNNISYNENQFYWANPYANQGYIPSYSSKIENNHKKRKSKPYKPK